MSEAKDLRGFKFRVRVRSGDNEVEIETGRTTAYPTLEALREMALRDLRVLDDRFSTLDPPKTDP